MKIHFGIKYIMFIIIFLFTIASALSYSKSDYLSLLSNTDYCSSNCNQIYRLYYREGITETQINSFDILVSRSGTSYDFTDASKETLTKSLTISSKPVISDFSMYYLKTLISGKNMSEYYEWTPTNPKEVISLISALKPDQYIDVKFTGEIFSGTIDIVLDYANFEYIEYATWTFDQLNASGYLLNNALWKAHGDSYSDSNHYAIRGIDNLWIVGLGWESGSGYPHWYKVDFGSNVEVNCTFFRKLGTASVMYVYNISYSTDNLTWTLVTPKADDNFGGNWINPTTNNSVAFANVSYAFDKVTARYMRISATAGDNNWAGIMEITFCNATSPFIPDTTPPSILFISQNPADITSTNTINTLLNITYNISDETSINLTSVYLYYKFNSTTRNNICFINGTACREWKNKTYKSNVSNTFLFQLEDNDIYPAIYNADDDTTDDFIHTTQTLGNANQYILTEFFNLSKNITYNFLEIMSNSTIIQRLYFCNESYLFNSAVDTSTNCVLFASIPANQQYNHSHSQYSSHQVIPFAINTTSGSIDNIGITEKSYFLLRGGVGTVNYYSVPNTTRTNTTRTTNNGGSSWSLQTYTIDAHIHQFSGNSSLYYYACANDTLGNGNCSIYRNDTYNLDNLPPTAPVVYSPTMTNYTGNISINYIASVSLSNATIGYYYIDLLNENFSLNSSITANNSLNLNYLWSSSSILYGNFIIRVTVVGTSGRTNIGYSNIFTVNNPTLSIISPADNTTFNQSTSRYIDFIIKINGVGTSDSCSLIINNSIINTQAVLFETETTFNNIARIKTGISNFYFNCTTYGSTALRNITLIDDINFTITSYATTTGLNNASVLLYFNYVAFGKFNIANFSVNNSYQGFLSSAYLTFNGLETDTTYVYSICGISDLDIEYCINDLVLRTKSYEELTYNETVKSNSIFMFIIIVAILLTIFILSIVFNLIPLSIISGTGFIIYGMVIITGLLFPVWLGYLVLMTGIFVIITGIFVYLGG